MNCKAAAESKFQWSFTIQLHVLSFDSPFEMISCFVLGKWIGNCSQASKPIEGTKGLGHKDESAVIAILSVFEIV